jgi:hypothetical protein
MNMAKLPRCPTASDQREERFEHFVAYTEHIRRLTGDAGIRVVPEP